MRDHHNVVEDALGRLIDRVGDAVAFAGPVETDLFRACDIECMPAIIAIGYAAYRKRGDKEAGSTTNLSVYAPLELSPREIRAILQSHIDELDEKIGDVVSTVAGDSASCAECDHASHNGQD